MCDCFHLAFPNWHAASSGTGPGRRLRAPEPGTEDDSTCDEPSQFTERERPRPQGSSPVEEYPETEKYTDSDKEGDEEYDPHNKSGSGKKTKKSGFGSMFEKRSTPKMSKLKEVHSPESGVIVKTAKDGCAEGLVYGGGGKEGIFIKEVVPESPASKSLKLKEGDQILSATVYFDNVSYEDAIQILEHAQAYKVKLCLKRKPHITESDPAIQSDVIPEEEVYTPEMREQGKTKRRSDARISWPKFPSLGRGRKSHFTRSHSSSEADEQRKLELSPTTSDTESPIKSQDALKGKKKKMKLSVLTKRGRISSSEDQDTDAPTSAQLLSPECLESPSGEKLQVYVTEDVKVVEDLTCEESDQKLTESQTVQHKVELITIDSTLKTEDLTVALAGQESPSGKKKKKERSELKMRILSKDKSHKKDAKGKSSPKRLKTLGASIEIADKPESEKLQEDQHAPGAITQISTKSMTPQVDMILPKVELEISDATLMQKSPQKGEENTKKGTDIKQKQEKQTGLTFKLPRIGFGDIATEDTIPEMNVNIEGRTTKPELTTEGTEVKEDPYDRLSKSSLSRTKLPKREDIEIPGMEDISMKTTVKGIKEPEAFFTGHHEDIQAETVQLSIDVDSVKEAVSKLPGFKMPKVDTSGVPIPEEITVIDANAQRISVKTPTKTKHDVPFSKFDDTATQEISKTIIKLPKITHGDLISDELLMVTHVDIKKPEMEYKNETKQTDKDVFKRENIIIPGKESVGEATILQTQETQGTGNITSEYQSAATFKSKRAKISMPSFGIAKPDIRIPDIGIHLSKGDNVKGERKIFLQEAEIAKQEKRIKIEGFSSDVKIPEIDGIEYIDSVDSSPAKKDGGIRVRDFGVNLDATSPKADICFPNIKGELKHGEVEEHTFKLPKFGAVAPDVSINVSDAKHINTDEPKIKTPEREGKGGKFKIPNLDISIPKVKGQQIDLSQSNDVDVKLPAVKAEGELPDIPRIDVTLGNLEQQTKVKEPDLEIKPWQAECELDLQGSKFKKPKFGIKMPKLKGPVFDSGSSKKDMTVTLPEAEVKLPEAPGIDVTLGTVSSLEQKVVVEQPEFEIKPSKIEPEINGQGSKFKLPGFGVKMPKIKGPELSLSKKDVGITLPEAKAETKLPDNEFKEPGIKVDIKSPEVTLQQHNIEGSPSKFKMPTFKLPTFGVGTPNVSVEVHDMDKDVAEANINSSTFNDDTPSVDVEGPSIDIKDTGIEHEGKGSKFKMPHLGFSLPKVKGPQLNLSSSKKDVDVTLPEVSAEIRLSEAPKIDASLGKAEYSISEAKLVIKKPEVQVRPLQTDVELEEQGGKLQMPKLGISIPKVKGAEIHIDIPQKDGDVTLPEAKAEVKVSDVPKGVVSLGKADVSLPKGEIEVKKPALETKPLQSEVGIDGQGAKFKMPKLGMSIPKMKGPDIHFGLSQKDGGATLPAAKAEVKVPEVELKESSANVEIKSPEIKIEAKGKEGSPSKFKMPTFKLPKFGVSTPNIEVRDLNKDVKINEVDIPDEESAVHIAAPNIDIEGPSIDMKATGVEQDGKGSKFKMPHLGFAMPKVKGPKIDVSLSKKDTDVKLSDTKNDIKPPEVDLGKVDISIPEAKMDVKPAMEMSFEMQTEGELEGQGDKLKMPKFGITIPKVKGPEIDLSLTKKDVDITLPEVKAEVSLPDAELKKSSTKVEIKAPEIDVQLGSAKGSPSKFKMPTFTLPKFGATTPKVKVEVPDVNKDIGIDGATVDVTAPSIETEGLAVDVNAKGGGLEGSGNKFKMPRFGISMPKIKGPEIDLSLSKKDVDITLPEAEAEVQLPDVNIKQPSATVEIKAPKIEAQAGNIEGSPSKFKMPTFTLPKFGATTPKVSVEAPDVNKDIGIDGATVDVTAPSIDTEGLSVDMKAKGGGLEGSGSKFKMPRFGISMPKIKGPEIDLSLSKKDVDITLPEAEAEVQLPDVNIKQPSATVEIKAPKIEAQAGNVEGSPTKFKMPTFTLPKFGATTQKVSVEAPDVNKDIGIDGATVDVTAPSIETEGLSVDVKAKGGEFEGSGSKIKMPKFGISMPEVKRPEIDLSLSKKDVDITLPKAEAEVQLPDVNIKQPSATIEIKTPKIEAKAGNVEGSPSKFKMPTFTLPKFGATTPKVKVEAPDVNKDIGIDGATVDVTAPSIETEGLSVDVKAKGGEIEGSGSKFKMPEFGISMPKVKGPEIDLSLSKKDVDITLPEAEAEVQLPDVNIKQPSATVEIKAPKIETQAGNVEGSPSKFKMPTFTLPKFGATTQKVSVEAPDVNKDIGIDGATLDVTAPSIETEGLSVDMKAKGGEIEGSGSKFKIPKFGISMPKVKGPEIDLSLSKKDVDITLPEAEAELRLPSVEVKKPQVDIDAPESKDTEGSPSKFKMPTFKLPKFGATTQKVSVEAPDVNKDIRIDGVTVDVTAPSIETEGLSVDVKAKGGEIEGSGSKFKMPKFGISMPKIKGPEIDLSLSKKDVDITLPEAEAEVQLPDVNIKQPSATVEIKAPKIEAQAGNVEGSPSKFKMPTFTLPKFGATTQKVSVEGPDVNKDIGIDGATLDVTAPSIETEGLSVDVKAKGGEIEGSGSKFKIPKFGISMPKVKGPEIDLSLSKDVDITLPEAEAEVQLPDVNIKQPSATMEIKAPKIEAKAGNVEGSPSKFKMPTFTLPKFGATIQKVSVEAPDVNKDIGIDGATVDVTAPSIDTEDLSLDVKAKGGEIEGSGSKFKMPKFGISMPKIKGPEIDLSLSKKDVDINLTEAEAELKLPSVEVKKTKVDIDAPEIKVASKTTEGSPSKFKMPTFKLPKFGVGTPRTTLEVTDMDKDINIDGTDIEIPEEVLTVHIAAPSIDNERTENEEKRSMFKLPSLGFSGPQIQQPDIDLSLSTKDVDLTLPAAKTEVKLPNVEVELKHSDKVEIKGPGIDVQTSNVEGSPSTIKLPTLKLPRFGAASPQDSVEVPDVDKDIRVDGANLKLPETRAEIKLPEVGIKEPVGSIPLSQKATIEGDAKLKKTSWTLPRFSFSKTSVKASEADINLDVPKVDAALPEVKTDIHLPDIDSKESSEIPLERAPITDLDTKMKKPRFSLPKFSFSKQSSKEHKVDVSIPDTEVFHPQGNVEIRQPEVDLKLPVCDVELEGQERKFEMPKFGISIPKVEGPAIDLSLSKDVDITLPEAEAEVQLPDVNIKQPSATVEIKAPKIEAQAGNVEGSPSKFKMPTFTLPKFGATTQKVSVEAPDVNKDIGIDGATVDVTAPSIETEGLSVDMKAKGGEIEGSGSKFKIPKFGISMPKVKGPEIDLSLSKKDVDITLPEAEAELRLPSVEVKKPEVDIDAPESKDTEGSPSKFKMPTFKLPKFGVGTPSTTVEMPDMDKNVKINGTDVKIPEEVLTIHIAAPSTDTVEPSLDIKTEGQGGKFKLPGLGFSKQPDIDLSPSRKDIDMTLQGTKADVKLSNMEVKESEGTISGQDAPVVEVESKMKRSGWTFPKFSFSRTGKTPDVDETPKAEVTSPEVKTEVHGSSGLTGRDVEEPPSIEVDANLKKNKFSLPRFSFARSTVKEPEVSAEPLCVDVCLPEGEVIVKQPDMKIKTDSALPKSKGPEEDTLRLQKDVGNTVSEVKAVVTDGKFEETDGAKHENGATVNIKVPSIDLKLDVSQGAATDSEMPDTETDTGIGSPSKFKLPLFTSFGDILKNIDVEFDVPKTDLETSTVVHEVHETDGTITKQLEAKEKETKQDTVKSPERTSWFRFPKFGLSSPSEPAKISEKDEHKDEKSPVGETVGEEISPTCSVQSSDAFADISSAMTSEHVGLSLSSPTKVTVKYSDPNTATGFGEMHSNIITSTTRTELISVEPNLPEKITILSSGVSSSSEDTLRLKSEKIHIITSKIQATPETQHGKLMTAVQLQSAQGFPLEPEANDAAMWTVEESQSGKKTIFQKHLVKETSSERSESKETIVITKQITRILDSSESTSGETASSIQRLRDSVHSEKMRFFDGTDK